MLITPISEDAWPGIMRIQARAYPAITPERESVLRSKWRSSPDTSLLCRRHDGQVLGYLLSHPWPHATPPALDREYAIPATGDTLYLHDLAVDPHAHGQGVGRRLSTRLLDLAKAGAFRRISLVSVQNSARFWAGLGFSPRPDVPVCAGYGTQATAMTLTLSSLALA